MITPRYGEALQWADALHREQRRKGLRVQRRAAALRKAGCGDGTKWAQMGGGGRGCSGGRLP